MTKITRFIHIDWLSNFETRMREHSQQNRPHIYITCGKRRIELLQGTMLFREFRWILQMVRERAYPPQSLKHPNFQFFQRVGTIIFLETAFFGIQNLSECNHHFTNGYREKWVPMGHETKRVQAMQSIENQKARSCRGQSGKHKSMGSRMQKNMLFMMATHYRLG